MDSGKKTSIANIKSFYSKWRGMNSGLAGIFAIIIIGVFPLAFRDYYFDILNFKTFFITSSDYLCSCISDGKCNFFNFVNLSGL